MIAADQLVGREVSFSKSGFQFPKGAYRVPTESPPSEFASGLQTNMDLLENETRSRNTGKCLFHQLTPLDSLSRIARRWYRRERKENEKKFWPPCNLLTFDEISIFDRVRRSMNLQFKEQFRQSDTFY